LGDVSMLVAEDFDVFGVEQEDVLLSEADYF
jgi:hypothetical protein